MLRLGDAVRRATARISAAFDRLPIRTRLAGVSALLTFIILCAFAGTIGSLTVHRIRSDFTREVTDTANQLPSQLTIKVVTLGGPLGFRGFVTIQPSLAAFAAPADHAVVRILANDKTVLAEEPKSVPPLDPPQPQPHTVHGYRVLSRRAYVRIFGSDEFIGQVFVQYGRRVSDTEATVARVELFLVLGVLAGTALALLAGMAIARRAMAPIAELTSTAEGIARTRDPSRSVPQPPADDEVAELARTLEGMLRELDAARAESESMLARQRQFVADASHELRTPLTSVLANLELLADALHGEEGDAAHAALRSSQRMRRLVADLLLLARTDVGRVVPRQRCDLSQIVTEAAGELGPIGAAHDISLEVRPVMVEAVRDEVYRLTINLLENAIHYTPPGSEIRASTGIEGGTGPAGADQARLVVEDDGPGVPPELAPTLFERFVRGAGDRGGSFGLGLAIVRAVAESHGGSVTLENRSPHGARFVVRLPLASHLDDDGQHHRPAVQAVVD